jgi:hypothetical protein
VTTAENPARAQRRRRAPLVVALAVTCPLLTSFVIIPTVPALAGRTGTTHFSNVPLLRPEGGTEPAIAVATDGTMAITALNSTLPLDFAYTNLWKGAFGSTPAYQGPIDARIDGSYGGADADVDIGATGTLHVTTLVEVFNPPLSKEQLGISSISCPGADTSNNYAQCTSQLIDTTNTDRPFIASDGSEVYIVYHDAGNSAGIRVQRSDDDGVTWNRVGDVTMGLGQITAGATYNNDIGPIVADPRSHAVYAIFSSGTPGLNKAKLPIMHRKVYVASSTDLGKHWTANLVYQGSPQTNFSNPFPGGLALDPVSGDLFAAVSDAHVVYFSKSTDGGKTWSSPVAILNVAPARTALFPAAAAFGGTVDVVYYGTSASSKDDPSAVWNVYMAKSTDSGEHFVQSSVTSTANHVGVVCTDGSACYRGDRQLADLFEVAIDPRSGLAAIAYAADTLGDPLSITSGSGRRTYLAKEGAFTKSLLDLPEEQMAGATTYVGLACPGDPLPTAVHTSTTPQIAVIMRGTCLFQDKAQSALDAGYDGFIVFNGLASTLFRPGDEVLTMFGGTYEDIPGEFVGHSTGLAIFDARSDADLVVGELGAPITVGRLRVQTVLAQEAA